MKIVFKKKKATTPKVILLHLSSHLPDLTSQFLSPLCFHYSLILFPDKILLNSTEPFAILTISTKISMVLSPCCLRELRTILQDSLL